MDDGTVTITEKMLTSSVSASGKSSSASQLAAQWAEARSVYPIYIALSKQFDLGLPFSSDKRALPERPGPDVFGRVRRWLDDMDQQVQTHQLRKLLQSTTLNASAESLRALILRHLRKPNKTLFDRDKIDFLLVQYFALCAPAKIYHKRIELADVAQVLRPVLGEVDPTPLEWCEPLERMIETLRTFRSLRDILRTNFIAEGRQLKESAGGMFYDPAALLAFIRFNFLLRRTFIELMHADLIAIRTALGQLEQAGIHTMDCRRTGLSAREPTAKLTQLVLEWKQPFQKEYTENSVSEAFERLLALRSDVEQALHGIHPEAGTQASGERPPDPSAVRAAQSAASAIPAKLPVVPPRTVQAAPKAATPRAASFAAKTNAAPASRAAGVPRPSDAPPARKAPSPPPTLDFETCMEKIWEQLIAEPPARGRSMTTVAIGTTRILMSSWEVASFVSEGGPYSEDLRRAVVARALLMAASDSSKASGNSMYVEEALAVARTEISHLQARVEHAKRAKDTEAGVNLGISTKRLLSMMDEAEKV